ncbi:MAG: hypothetical protein HUJ31_14345 [Pseudomonadales bacterium]|nr:hypothetical protein [Pseudomonadales bacterium]
MNFELLDVQGEPVADEEVQFELTTDVGGLSLSRTAGKTDDQGQVTTIVNAGFIPTTVRVKASLDVDTDSPPDGVNDTTLETLSDQLSINTGIADQNSMSVSASTLNIEGDQFDGITTTLTVRMSDKFNNPVFDGTAVAFRSELGSIDGSCNTTGGACAVTLTSQEPRSPLDPNVEFNTLSDDSCPTAFIYEESVTISGTDGDTDYLADDIHRVETNLDVALVEDTDYTVDDDGSGITCEAASATCIDAATLKISYDRAWLDEEGDGTGGTHPIPNPGAATAPYTTISNVPCLGAFRERDQDASGFYGGMGQLYGGRSTVLLYAQGEESFVDSNANGQYDLGEPFVDLTEAFHDMNEDGVYGNPDSSGDIRTTASPNCYGPASPIKNANTPQDEICYQIGGDEEEFVDFNADGQFNAGNGIYNGTLCPKEVSDRTDTSLSCNNADDPCTSTDQFCTRTLLHIRQQIPILLSGSGAYMGIRDAATGEYITAVDLNATSGAFTAFSDVTANNGLVIPAGTEFTVGYGDTQVRPGIGEAVLLTSGSGSVIVDISDRYNGTLPAGTSVAVTSGTDGCAIQNSPGTTVPSYSGIGFTQIFISLGQPENPAIGSAPITTTVSTGLAAPTQTAFTCSH